MSASSLKIYSHLQRAAHLLNKRADRALIEAAGVTTAQAAVLVIIASGTKTTQRDIAAALGINESAMTAMMVRLERMQLVAKCADPTDRRSKTLQLSKQGQQVLGKARPAFATINALIDQAIGADDMDGFGNALSRLSALLLNVDKI